MAKATVTVNVAGVPTVVAFVSSTERFVSEVEGLLDSGYGGEPLEAGVRRALDRFLDETRDALDSMKHAARSTRIVADDEPPHQEGGLDAL